MILKFSYNLNLYLGKGMSFSESTRVISGKYGSAPIGIVLGNYFYSNSYLVDSPDFSFIHDDYFEESKVYFDDGLFDLVFKPKDESGYKLELISFEGISLPQFDVNKETTEKLSISHKNVLGLVSRLNEGVVEYERLEVSFHLDVRHMLALYNPDWDDTKKVPIKMVLGDFSVTLDLYLVELASIKKIIELKENKEYNVNEKISIIKSKQKIIINSDYNSFEFRFSTLSCKGFNTGELSSSINKFIDLNKNSWFQSKLRSYAQYVV